MFLLLFLVGYGLMCIWIMIMHFNLNYLHVCMILDNKGFRSKMGTLVLCLYELNYCTNMLLMYVCDMQEPNFLNSFMILHFIENLFLDLFRNHCIWLSSLFLIIETHHLQQVWITIILTKTYVGCSRNSCIRIFFEKTAVFRNYLHKWNSFENTSFRKISFWWIFLNSACLRKSFTCVQIFEITTM